MDDARDPEARETLAKLEERLRRDVRDMLEVLRADVPVFFRRTVKLAFEESEGADALDEAAVRRLKAESERRADEVGRELVARLERFDAWLTPTATTTATTRDAASPRDARALDEHPSVGPALRQVGAALRELLDAHGLAGALDDERLAYKLPTYFVAGHYMKSLVESFWQNLGLYHRLAGQLAAGAKDEQRQARRSRWESA